MTAVAVWDVTPSADEILSKRLAGGWKPMPSMLQGGDKILGHAACLVMMKQGSVSQMTLHPKSQWSRPA